MKEQKKGISLIVLVITIIVMLILASAVIISLSNSNIITKAKEAVLKTDVKNFAQELSVSLAEQKLNNKYLEIDNVTETDLAEIKKYIPNFDEKYAGKIFIQNGELVYDASKVTENEKTALESIGIKSGKIYTPVEIKAIIEEKNLGTDVHTTDITKYVEGLSKKEAEKYTICQGDLYYRYEKTTFEERKELYANGILFLAGDANENGILDQEDINIIQEHQGWYNYTTENVLYVCDIDMDLDITSSDSEVVSLVLANKTILKHEVADISQQEPERVRIIGDWWKTLVLESKIDKSAIAVGYTELVKYIPELRNDYFAERVVILGGKLKIRYDKLTEIEKDVILNEMGYRTNLLIGDGNCDGYVTQDDLTILDNITKGTTPTDVQEVVLDINGDGTIDTSDLSLLDQYIQGAITYNDML